MHTLNRSSLAEQIAQHIIERIYAGEFKPSAMLPSENELAERYQVSRPVVREALQSLSAQEFIEIVRGKGSYVQEVNAKPLRLFFQRAMSVDPAAWMALLEVRQVLEITSAGLAARNRTEAEVSQLQGVIDALTEHAREAEEDHDYGEYAGLDVKFHVAVARASKNEFLFYLIESIRHSLTAMNMELLGTCLSPLISQLAEAHKQVFWAIRDGKPEQAEVAMRKHYDLVFEGISAYQEQDQDNRVDQ